MSPVTAAYKSLVKWLIAFFLLLQAHFHLADRVLNMIFRFLKAFFISLGQLSAPCAIIADELPKTVSTAQKSYTKALKKTSFQMYPVCKRCGTVSKYVDCIEGNGTNQKAKLYLYVHPLSRGRQKQTCKGILLKTVELASKHNIFYPLMTYFCIDLHTSFQQLLLSSDFVSKCTHWKSRSVCAGTLADVYDGNI